MRRRFPALAAVRSAARCLLDRVCSPRDPLAPYPAAHPAVRTQILIGVYQMHTATDVSPAKVAQMRGARLNVLPDRGHDGATPSVFN